MTKIRHRIYTEHVNVHHIQPIVDKYFFGYSLFHGMGVWEGKHERCLVIEIIVGWVEGKGYNREDVIAICREINTINHQQCCLVTTEKVDMMVIAERK